MSPLRCRLPLRQRVPLVATLSCALALVAGGTVLVGTRCAGAHRALESDLGSAAHSLGQVLAEPLAGNEPAALARSLSALALRDDARSAGVYDGEGRLLASWSRDGEAERIPLRLGPAESAPGLQDWPRSEVRSARGRVGTVVIEPDRGPLHARLLGEVRSLGLIGVGVLALVWGVSMRLRRMILDPLRDLSSTMHAVRDTGNPELRAARPADEDMGALVDLFHAMLDELNLHQDRLEDEVQVRTQELVAARDAAREASRAKSEFLANISHEIRTPLNGVIGMSELLVEREPDLERRGMLETVHGCGRHLLEIVEDLLDYSRIEAGRVELEEQDFDARLLVEEVTDLFAARCSESGVELLCHVPAGVPPLLRGDPGRLRQVLMHLLSNAVKFTQRGEVRVELSCSAQPDGRTTLHLAVHDTGVGIPSERLEVLFEAFAQVDGSSTRRFGGTGLGLAICQRLAELMQGRIEVHSSVGEGSTFVLHVPLEVSARDPEPLLDEPALLMGLQVLVVDDNATGRDILRRQLTAWGCEVTLCSGAPAARRALGRAGARFDLALLDHRMPGTDGVELAPEVRSAGVPVLLLTSLGVKDHLKDLLASGIEGHLTKPVHGAQLRDAVATLVARHRREVADSLRGVAPPPEPPSLVDERSLGETRLRRRPRVLVVQGSTLDQRVTLAILQRGGYRAEVAGDGAQAAEVLGREAFDAVLADTRLPDMDARELVRLVRATAPRAGTPPPFLVIESQARDAAEAGTSESGVECFISRPLQPTTLFHALEQVLRDGRKRKDPVD